ncbi:MAG: hypothetical protein WC959_10860 [Kiritimatiellales bacterium]
MKKLITLCILGLITCAAGDEISFNLSGLTAVAGDPVYAQLTNNAGPVSVTLDGLTAIFTANTGTMHRTGSGFGIRSDAGSVTYEIEASVVAREALLVQFDQDVEITLVDLRRFENGETFNVIFDSTDHLIGYDDLTNKTTAIYATSWFISAGKTVEFTVLPGSGVSLDGFTVTVVPEPAAALILASSLLALGFYRRFFCLL